MDAANELIWGYSYGAVTVDAICERAMVRKGSFYHFFDSKSDLPTAAIEAWWDECKLEVEELFRPEVPPLERIWKYLGLVTQRQIKSYDKNGQILGCPLFTLASEICTQDELLRLLIQDILNSFIHYFEDAVRQGQASGEIEGTNPVVKSRLLWGFYEGTLSRARIENNPKLIRNLRLDAIELLGARPCALTSVAE